MSQRVCLVYVYLITYKFRKLKPFSYFLKTDDEYKIVSTPAFAESVSEGDVKWDKSNVLLI